MLADRTNIPWDEYTEKSLKHLVVEYEFDFEVIAEKIRAIYQS